MLEKRDAITTVERVQEWSLYLLCIAIPLSKSGVEIFATSAGLAWLLRLCLQGKFSGVGIQFRKQLSDTPELIGALCVFAAALLSALFSVESLKSLNLTIGKLGEYVLLFAAILSIPLTPKRIDNILGALLIASFCFGALVFYRVFTDEAFFSVFYTCLSDGALAGVPGMTYLSRIGGFAGMLGPIFLMQSVQSTQNASEAVMRKTAYFCATLLLFCCVPFSRSPSAMVGVFMAIIWLWFVVIRKASPTSRKTFLPLAATGVLAVVLGLGWEWNTTDSFFEFHFSECHRLVWSIGSRMFHHNPWYGCGFGVYQQISGRFSDAGDMLTYPPSSLMQILGETGLLGLLAYVFFGVLFFMRLFQLKASFRDPLLCGLWAGIGSFLLQSITDNNLYSVQLSALFWTMLGLLGAWIRMTLQGDKTASG